MQALDPQGPVSINSLFEIENGVSNTDLRETFGYCGKSISKNSTSMYLFAEECLYAVERGLILPSLSYKLSIDNELVSFYSNMRNRGVFLTRSLASVL